MPATINVELRLKTNLSLANDTGAPLVEPSFIKVRAVVVIAT